METKIKLIQQPVIQHELQRIGAEIIARIDALNIAGQVATEDTVKSLKEMRAQLNREATEWETQRKALKEAIMQPYNEVNDIFKVEIADKYKWADETLKSKISEVEMKLKTDKRNDLIDYFNEICEFNNIDFLRFESIISEVNISTTEKKYKEHIFEFVNQVAEDLALIETETYAAEILIEYKKTLKASASIAAVRTRKEQENLEQERILRARTDRRVSSLLALGFVSNEMTHTYRFVSDESVFVKFSDIETLDNDQWNKIYVSLENEVKERQKQKQSVSAPKTEPAKVAEQPKQETKTEPVKEPVYTATFEVSGTYAELTKLKNFLTENKFNYKNI